MNWDAIGAMWQMFGSVAVLVTLAYLAAQVRLTGREVQRNVGQANIDSAQEILLAQATHPSLNAVYVKANANLGFAPSRVTQTLMDRAGLTEEEARVLNSHQMAWWQHRVEVIPYLDTMLPYQRKSYETATHFYFAVPLNRLWYEEMKANLHLDAVRYIDDLLAHSA